MWPTLNLITRINVGSRETIWFSIMWLFSALSSSRVSTYSVIEATSHMRRRARNHYTSSTLIGGKGGASPSSFHTTLRDQHSMWMQDGREVYMIPTWHPMDRVSWSLRLYIFKSHFLEVVLTQNWEIMTLQMLTTVYLFYFMMCEDPHE